MSDEDLKARLRDLEAIEWLQKMADTAMFSGTRHNARRVQDIIERKNALLDARHE